jgi:hypothetical protein
MLGISWFWLAGATYLSQFPAYVRFILGAEEPVVTLFSDVIFRRDCIWLAVVQSPARRQAQRELRPLGGPRDRDLLGRRGRAGEPQIGVKIPGLFLLTGTATLAVAVLFWRMLPRLTVAQSA